MVHVDFRQTYNAEFFPTRSNFGTVLLVCIFDRNFLCQPFGLYFQIEPFGVICEM